MGGLAPGRAWACWSAVKASFQSSCSSPWRKRSGSGSASRTTARSPASGSAAISARLTWLPLIEIEAARRSASSTGGEGIGLLVLQPRALDHEVERVVEVGDQRGRDGVVQRPVELRRRRPGRGAPGRRGSPTPPRCGSGPAGAIGRARSGDRRPPATAPCWPGRDRPRWWRSAARRARNLGSIRQTSATRFHRSTSTSLTSVRGGAM